MTAVTPERGEDADTVLDWLQMAEAQPLVGMRGVLRHPPICQTELDAIRRLAAPPVSVGWQPIETAPRDGTEVLILAGGMAIQAFFLEGAWGPDIPGEVREYHGAVWVAFDDLTQFEVEEGALEGGLDYHGGVTHWMPLPTPPEGEG